MNTIIGLLLLTGLILTFFIYQFRLMNTGYSQWWALLCLIPIINLALLAVCLILPEGYKDTRKLDHAGKIAFGILIAAITLIVALIVILESM